MLDARYVDRLHARLLVRYGAQWLRMYDGLDEAMVKADWAQTLAGVSADGIRYALENLPADWPPNAGQFRALCSERRTDGGLPALPGPGDKPAPEVMAKIASIGQSKPKAASPAQEVAAGLRRRMADGQKLTGSQRWVLQCCERTGAVGVAEIGEFRAIPADALPEGMRA